MKPTAELAARIAEEFLGAEVHSARRFTTGLHHFVYEAAFGHAASIVVRIGARESRADLAGAVFWSERLAPLGVPLARVLRSDLAMQRFPFPYMLLERLPGTDLVDVYTSLTPEQRRGLAHRIVELQQIAGELPRARGFGYAHRENASSMFASWKQVLTYSLARSAQRIERTRVIDPAWIRRVEALLDAIDDQLDQVEPRAFFHDTTTKNVIIDQGALSGIVDLDTMAYGDPLLPVALTRTSILSRGWETDYIDGWTEAIELTGDDAIRLDAYTALFAVNFLSEFGQTLNQDAPLPVDREKRERLIAVLAELAS